VTVGAQQRDIVGLVVAPISIDVFDLHGDSAGNGVARVPPAAAAPFAETVHQILPYETVAVVNAAIAPGLQAFSPPLEFVGSVAFQRTELLLGKGYRLTANHAWIARLANMGNSTLE